VIGVVSLKNIDDRLGLATFFQLLHEIVSRTFHDIVSSFHSSLKSGLSGFRITRSFAPHSASEIRVRLRCHVILPSFDDAIGRFRRRKQLIGLPSAREIAGRLSCLVCLPLAQYLPGPLGRLIGRLQLA